MLPGAYLKKKKKKIKYLPCDQDSQCCSGYIYHFVEFVEDNTIMSSIRCFENHAHCIVLCAKTQFLYDK